MARSVRPLIRLAVLVAVAVPAAWCAPAGAITITEYSAGQIPFTGPSAIAVDAHDNAWVVDALTGNIVEFTPSGHATAFAAHAREDSNYDAPDITAGPDGNMWFTEPRSGAVARITPTGQITEFPAPVGGIVSGPQGALWVASLDGGIARITTDGTVTPFSAAPPIEFLRGKPAAGADGNLWAEDDLGPGVSLEKVSADGTFTTVATPFQSAWFPAAGPLGRIWLVGTVGPGIAELGSISASGAITTLPNTRSLQLNSTPTAGPDGNLWVKSGFYASDSQLARITPTGKVTLFPANSTPGGPIDIVAGRRNDLWFIEYDNAHIAHIARVTQLSAPGGGLPKPGVSHMRVVPTRDGHSVLITLDSDGASTLDFAACRPNQRHCPLSRPFDPLSHPVHAGTNRFRFSVHQLGHRSGRLVLFAFVVPLAVSEDSIEITLAHADFQLH
jgi:virginiamycin B lyase